MPKLERIPLISGVRTRNQKFTVVLCPFAKAWLTLQSTFISSLSIGLVRVRVRAEEVLSVKIDRSSLTESVDHRNAARCEASHPASPSHGR